MKTSDPNASALMQRFVERFGARPRLFRAPGRINLIGDHTDYADGMALPAAIDRACLIAAAPNDSGTLRLVSLTLAEEVERPAAPFERRGHWSDYIAGCAAALQARGCGPQGWDMAIESSIPLGAGVSSSAALCVAASLAMASRTGPIPPRAEARKLAFEAEQAYVGMPCGPLDQFASLFGRHDHALLLDCRSLEANAIPLPTNLAFLLVDSGVKHQLTDGGYAQRRSAAEEAAKLLGLKALRDAQADDLNQLEGLLRRRARHVVTENARVLAMASALRAGALSEAGRLMGLSHQSLRDDFAVTCPQTDALAEIAVSASGVYGARQMGGGFGGCVLALAETGAAEAAGAEIARAYAVRTNLEAEWFICRAADGAGELFL
jgi:galactokinase